MRLSPFRIERFYARYEFTTRYMLSSSDCESRTIGELLELEPDAHERLLHQWCGYTESLGAPELRDAIAALYGTAAPDDVIVASCAEEGIFLLYHALLGAGDHAIVETPCYESALQLARSTGAEVSAWERRYEDGWAHDLDELERLIAPNTRVLYINQPHNPTGTLMSHATFERVVELAREHDLVLFCDEVYRELEHDPADRLPAACDLYERAVSLGSISKTLRPPGAADRLARLPRRADSETALAELKDYTTICSSAPSELLVALALRHRQTLIDAQPRTREPQPAAARRLLLPATRDVFEWVKPTAGPIGFPRVTASRATSTSCARRLAEGRRAAASGIGVRPARPRARRVRSRESPGGAGSARVAAKKALKMY